MRAKEIQSFTALDLRASKGENSTMRGFICFCVFIAASGVLQAATFTAEVTDLVGSRGIPNVRVEFIPRHIAIDADDRATLDPIAENDPALVTASDLSGSVAMEVPEGFVAIRIRQEGFAEYFNALIPVAEAQKKPFRIELTSAEPNEIEAEILNQRRISGQMAARSEEAALIIPEAPPTAAAQPVVPSDVFVSNLNGYTGNMNLDEYITGVVSAELGDSFPYESLKAQAVAARTYALARLRDRGYANGGQAYTSTLGSRSRAAALNSSGVALTYNSAYITAFFSARCNGDFTLASEDGLSGLATCTPGGLVGGQVIAYLRKVPCSGHINCSQTTEQCCNVTVDGRAQHLYGHGVGLCQRGAQQLAGVSGLTWDQIVNRYYTAVTTLPGQRISLGDRIEMITAANRRTVACSGTASSTAQGTKGTLIAGPTTIACTLISGSSWITWWRVAFDTGARGWVAEDFIIKSPAVQNAPVVELSVSLAAAATVQIRVSSLPNASVALEESMDFRNWIPLATNTLATNGLTSFSRPTVDGRYYRARLQLPDTAP